MNQNLSALASLGHPCKFQRVSSLDSITERHSSSRRQPNCGVEQRVPPLYRQGGHHLGHWPTFLAFSFFITSPATAVAKYCDERVCVKRSSRCIFVLIGTFPVAVTVAATALAIPTDRTRFYTRKSIFSVLSASLRTFCS